MGSVICTFRILPDPAHFEQLRARLQALKPMQLTEEPIAFGLKALVLKLSVPEEEGAIDKIENTLAALPGVKECETMLVTRAL